MSYDFEDTSHTCKVCGTQFTQKDEHMRHMLSHAGDTQHKCGKKLQTKIILQIIYLFILKINYIAVGNRLQRKLI